MSRVVEEPRPSAARHRGLVCAAMLLACLLTACSTDVEGASGPYSALTRQQLEVVSADAPPYVPASLPRGLDPASSAGEFEGTYTVGDRRFEGDTLPFWLLRVETDAETPEWERQVTTTYRSAVLGGQETWYEVRQYPEGSSLEPRCHRPEEGQVRREVKGALLLVCSPELAPGQPDWEYWSSVEFTDRIGDVEWLRGG